MSKLKEKSIMYHVSIFRAVCRKQLLKDNNFRAVFIVFINKYVFKVFFITTAIGFDLEPYTKST